MFFIKNFLIACIGIVLGVHAAYCGGGPYIDFRYLNIETLYRKYMEGSISLYTAQAICVKMFEYADAHNVEFLIRADNGEMTRVTSANCHSKYAIYIAVELADRIKNADITVHSNCVQGAIERAAYAKCGTGSDETFVGNPIVQCSTTDNRCVVGRTLANSPEVLRVACCTMPKIECDETSSSDGSGSDDNAKVIYFNTPWTGVLAVMPGLNNFDYNCNFVGSGDDLAGYFSDTPVEPEMHTPGQTTEDDDEEELVPFSSDVEWTGSFSTVAVEPETLNAPVMNQPPVYYNGDEKTY